MRLSDWYDGSDAPFQGDRALSLRRIPANAQIRRATATVTPIDATKGMSPYAETIRFNGSSGDWGATKTPVPGRWVEVDFHGRRTLAGVRGSNLNQTTLQVDLGGAYVEINTNGAFKTPGDGNFTLSGDQAPLPGLTVTKFKLTTLSASTSPDVAEVTIRSVPTNVSLRLGEMPPFWTHLGEMTQPETTPDFAAVLQAFLVDAKVENGFYVVPLVMRSDTIARLAIALEIEYSVQESVLPAGLNEVVLPFDLSSIPKAQQNVLQLTVPANARVARTTARVTGAFEETRIVQGPVGAVSPAGTVQVSPTSSQAQIISLDEAVAATAVDLLVAVTRTARLQLDLREDLDGKPGNASLLPGPVGLELLGPVGLEQDREAAGQPRWVSASLPAEFQFQTGRGYWLVLQSLEGEAVWSVARAPAGTLGMQRTQDGGLSWRDTMASRVSSPVTAFFRLRRRPERFQVPIELQVGTGDQAVRVKLDRFQPLGRVDFALDFDEVAQAFNQYLATASPASCPETEHIVNGEFEQWLRVGDQLMPPTTIDLSASPTTVAVAPDGSWAYVGLDAGLLQAIDVACDEKIKEIDLYGLSPNALAISPDGTRAYVTGSQQLQVIDMSTHRALGDPLNLQAEIKALALSPDGSRLYVLYVAESSASGATASVSRIRAINTAKLEQLVIHGQPTLQDLRDVSTEVDLSQLGSPTALAVAPDESRLYVTIIKPDNSGEVRLFDTATLQPSGDAVAVGQEPSAIALTPDGKQAIVANADGNSVSLINTATRAVSSINVGQAPIAVAVSPEGTRAYVANSADNTLSIIDLTRRVVTQTIPVVTKIPVGTSTVALALSPQGDRIYMAIAYSGGNLRGLLSSIQVGTRLPAEWNLVSGWVAPFCLPDPFHLIAVLGQTQGRVKIGERRVAAMPSALSQTVPVAESCPYEFSFWGIATEPDAVAEVLWLGPDCGLLRTDQVPIKVLERQAKVATPLALTEATGAVARRPRLMLHRVRLIAPAGANQAEVRFSVPTGVVAGIDRVSLTATAEAVANADLALQQDGQLADWTLLPGAAPSVSLLAVDGGVQLRNAGADVAELIQVVPAKADQPFTLEFQGRTVGGSAQVNPRVELRWLKADGSSAGSPTILQILPTGFDSSVANGTAPTEATQAEIHLVVPARTTQEVKRVSLRFSTPTLVPVTFIAQAPGELTVSNWRVAFERAEMTAPQVPDKGLCPPTPPGCQPGETPSDRCFCPCCETERTMTETTPMVTPADRPALVGRCPTCGAPLVRFSGPRVLGAPPFTLRPLAARHPIVLSPITTKDATVQRDRLDAGAAVVMPLTVIPGIGEARARRLAEAGIDSIEKLATATPEEVARALRKVGVSAKHVARLIEEARRLLASGETA